MIPEIMIKYRTPFAKKDFIQRFYERQWSRFCNWIDRLMGYIFSWRKK